VSSWLLPCAYAVERRCALLQSRAAWLSDAAPQPHRCNSNAHESAIDIDATYRCSSCNSLASSAVPPRSPFLVLPLRLWSPQFAVAAFIELSVVCSEPSRAPRISL
jgi:hypothetical protein